MFGEKVMSKQRQEYIDVIIIGAGLSGVGAACYLKMNTPKKKYAILEAREGLGGTWDLFKYPGIRSDSAMYTLGYKFKPWTGEKTIAPGSSILNYIKEAASEYNVDQNIRYSTKLVAANWSSEEKNWVLTIKDTNTGKESELRCGYLHMCSGYYDYDKGYTPKFPGLEKYQGEFVHPQKWDESINYSNKKIIVIGSGATAVTLIPELAKKAKMVTMLQRSPTFISSLPEVDLLVVKFKELLPNKVVYKATRWKHILGSMAFYSYCQKFPLKARKFLLEKTIKSLDSTKISLKHFEPKYNPWDQRLCAVPDGDLFDTLRAGKADIVTDEIDTFEENGIRLKSGEFLEADLIVSATGLNLKFLDNIKLSVDDKVINLNNVVSFKSAMLSGVPNMSMVFGYTNSAWTLKADLVNEWVAKTLAYMDKRGFKTVTPIRQKDMQEKPYINLSSGYVKRAISIMPRQGDRNPWQNNQNYFKDIYLYKFRKISDKELDFQS